MSNSIFGSDGDDPNGYAPIVKVKGAAELEKERDEAIAKLKIAVEAMKNVRSELTSANINNEWCIDQICEALNEIETDQKAGKDEY